MVISEKSQLGLRFIYDKKVKIEVANLCLRHIKKTEDKIGNEIKKLEEIGTDFKNPSEKIVDSYEIPDDLKSETLGDFSFGSISRMFGTEEFNKQDLKYFLVMDSVFKAAELIKIGENFTGRTLKDIKHGDYMYLLGKNKMIKFLVVDDGIKGIYYNDLTNDFFEWGVKMETGEYFYYNEYKKEFSQVMQILTFIELGDIEVSVVNSLQKIKGSTKQQDTYNGTKNTVYIVDSSWNKLLIRTDGFAVRGHFRLQPCGIGMKDRTLIWIDAFEKHGYTRQPRAKIIQ